MHYILDPNQEGIQFRRYLQALAGYSAQLPPHVAEFAADEQRFMLNHPRSLHDAWLKRVVVTETRLTGDSPSAVRVELVLLGQDHDREIWIIYDDVSWYEFRGRGDEGSTCEAFHGDIFTHEVRVSEQGQIVHEVAFVTDSVFTIECQNFTVQDKLVSTIDGEAQRAC